MKDIKDYLHLYLMCKYQWKDGDGEWRRPEYLTAYQLSSIIRTGREVRLILRPLSDMTEYEVKELIKYEKIIKEYERVEYRRELGLDNRLLGITIFYNVPTDDGSFSQVFNIRFHSLNAEDFAFLLQKGFDLFNLISNGLAIDATKIKKP